MTLPQRCVGAHFDAFREVVLAVLKLAGLARPQAARRAVYGCSQRFRNDPGSGLLTHRFDRLGAIVIAHHQRRTQPVERRRPARPAFSVLMRSFYRDATCGTISQIKQRVPPLAPPARRRWREVVSADFLRCH